MGAVFLLFRYSPLSYLLEERSFMFEALLILGGGFFIFLVFSHLRRYFKKHERIIDWKIEDDKNLSNEGSAKYIRLALLNNDKANPETKIRNFNPRAK